MLLGEYEHSIDEKNRLTLPARFRESFSEGVVISRGMDRCLSVYPCGEWERAVDARLGRLDPLSREARSLQRYFYSAAAEAELDKQGQSSFPRGWSSTQDWGETSSSPASATGWRSGTATSGSSNETRSKGARSMLPNALQPSEPDHVPVLADEVRELLDVNRATRSSTQPSGRAATRPPLLPT